MNRNPFEKLGLPQQPILLAPLAGVSDHPFRRICQRLGADLTYVEMISATALTYNSQRTFAMLCRHPDEKILGVQITSKSAEEMAAAVRILDPLPFETIDINMGCPVKKVVNAGCGSAILKDPERVYRTTLAATSNTSKPVSVKIRLGWDHQSINCQEIGLAAQEAGAQWLTIHGRTRSDSYGDPVNLEKIAELKRSLRIPVIGNGNLFSSLDAAKMRKVCGVDGLMISRGALGNPWIFAHLKGKKQELKLSDWLEIVLLHCEWQEQAYGQAALGAICMRKHILWYVSGWPNARKIRDAITRVANLQAIKELLVDYTSEVEQETPGLVRMGSQEDTAEAQQRRFLWDPKYEMDRSLDRGVGCEAL